MHIPVVVVERTSVYEGVHWKEIYSGYQHNSNSFSKVHNCNLHVLIYNKKRVWNFIRANLMSHFIFHIYIYI